MAHLIKRCKYCGAKNVTIAHFGKKHQKQIQAARHRKHRGKPHKTPGKHTSSVGRQKLSRMSREKLMALYLLIQSLLRLKHKRRGKKHKKRKR